MLERALRTIGIHRSPIPHLNRHGLSRRFVEVLNGNKPATLVEATALDVLNMGDYWRVDNKYNMIEALRRHFIQRGFESVPVTDAANEIDIVIARRENFGHFLDTNPPISIPQFDERVQRLVKQEHLRELSLVEAVQVLFKRKGIDPDDESISHAADLAKVGLEYPEDAILLGKALGYPNCDVKYYVETRYMIKPRDPYEDGDIEPIYDKRFDSLNSVVCPDCFQKAIAQHNFVKISHNTRRI